MILDLRSYSIITILLTSSFLL